MFKLVAFTALLAVAAAAPGFIGGYGGYGGYGAPLAAPLATGWGHGVVSAPLISTGVVKTAVPVATSYANSVRVAFTALLAVAAAAPGFIGGYGGYGGYGAPLAAPLATGWGHGVVSAPLISTGVVKTAVPVATSYANSVRLASPAVAVAHAPLVAAHAPLVAAPAYAHGW